MPRELNLVQLIKKLIQKSGSASADDILCGMMTVHKGYFELKRAIENYLKDMEV